MYGWNVDTRADACLQMSARVLTFDAFFKYKKDALRDKNRKLFVYEM